MIKEFLISLAMIGSLISTDFSLAAKTNDGLDSEKPITLQKDVLDYTTPFREIGPQSPRDIDRKFGTNRRVFGAAPTRRVMNLCNIHLHKNAEHRGGEFTTYAGPGDGYRYDGELTEAELTSPKVTAGISGHGYLVPGDTIEVHFVYTSADASPGPSLAACFSEAITNPQLRVEAVVAVLVSDDNAADFTQLAAIEKADGYYQAPKLPENLGDPVSYAGSTTGPDYNAKASPFQVSWNVRPKVMKVDINSVVRWLSNNPFREDHPHGVRNLVTAPEFLSPID